MDVLLDLVLPGVWVPNLFDDQLPLLLLTLLLLQLDLLFPFKLLLALESVLHEHVLVLLELGSPVSDLLGELLLAQLLLPLLLLGPLSELENVVDLLGLQFAPLAHPLLLLLEQPDPVLHLL